MQINPALTGQSNPGGVPAIKQYEPVVDKTANNPDPVQLPQKHSKLDKDELQKVTDQFNEVLKTFDIQAKFSVHEKTNEIIVSIINIQTDEVIREIPPRKILDMVARMMEMVGVIIDEKA